MVPSHRFCTVCGASNQAQDAFCFACGISLQSTTPSPQYPVAGAAITTLTGLLPPNLLLKQRYHIVSQVGKGGFGAVFKAEDIQLGNRFLAIKEMSQSGLSPQEIIEATDAFKREAHMLASLKHPNLPSIYDYFNEAGRWYLVMDFIEGETLEEHLNKEKEGSLPCEEVLQIGIQLCTVLGYLHNRQPPIIFRDLKPANVMLTTEGHLYLIDFGIARHFKPGQMRDTIAFGSPGYAAPEQYGKTQTTSRADIYSLGATLHQMLTGDNPSDTPFYFATLQLRGQPTTRGLETLIMQMVDLDESKRPDGMDIIKQKLQSIAITQTAKQINFPQPGVPVQSVQPSKPLPLAQTSTSGVSQKNEKQYWLDRGNDLYKAKRYLDALYACEQAQRHDPDDASIYKLEGGVFRDLKRYQEALTAFERAIQLDPNLASAYNGKGSALINLKRYEEALAACEQAIQLDPNFASAYGNKCVTLINLKRYEEALTVCEQALQLDPNSAVTHSNKGSIFFTLKRYEEALASLEQAIRLDPSNAEIYNNKGTLLYELKRYEEALTVYEQALRFDPNLAIAYSNKGKTLVMLKRYDAALASLEQALQLDPNLAIAYFHKGSVLERLGRSNEARLAFKRAHLLGYNG
jgi:serine/threonine protein kinase